MMNTRFTATAKASTISENAFRNIVPSYYNNNRKVHNIINSMINKNIINHPNRTLVKMTKVMHMSEAIIERDIDNSGNLSQSTFVDHIYITYNDTVYGRCVAELRIGYDHIMYTPTGVQFCGDIVSMRDRVSQEYDIERIPRR